MVMIPDEAANERWIKAQHHVPAGRHDVAFAVVRGANQNDRARLEKPADFIDGKILLFDHAFAYTGCAFTTRSFNSTPKPGRSGTAIAPLTNNSGGCTTSCLHSTSPH